MSDLFPTGESADATESGLKHFLDVATKYRAAVQLVAPGKGVINAALAERLNLGGREIECLDSDPKSLFQWAFDSVLNLSRKLTGSRRTVKNG